MKTRGFESLRVYRLSETLADNVWNCVLGWNNFARDTVGKQIVRAADRIGANIAEGVGRGSYQDNHRFIRMSRASLYETRHWLRRAYRRQLIEESDITRLKALIDELGPKVNAYLTSISPVSPDTTNDQ